MPKVGASMAQVSTDYVPVEPDLYHAILGKPVWTQKDSPKGPKSRQQVKVPCKILSGEETGTQYADKTVNDRISLHTKEGEENEFGFIQLKRYVEAGLPESDDWDEERWEEFDTDELAAREVQLVVVQEDYEADIGGGRKETRKQNRITRVLRV